MGSNAICIHGHFYQPPREDPLNGEIPLEPGASPYRNWNERIHDHCYRPNAELGNFQHISFNIGPTLFQWMDTYDPQTLSRIIEQDHHNVERNGIGNAMAQAYNHTILPLSPLHDKITQVHWGIGDFESRFGHKPSGMWLPETAVDTETLEVLADAGIEFTILAPWQSAIPGVDDSRPYKVKLSGGKEITVFFYHQELSMRMSFDPGVSVNADQFVLRTLAPKYKPYQRKADPDQIFIIASDGELYGHHQPFRDKFLAYLMDGALREKPITPTYPALWLREHPVVHTVEIKPNTSWSCYHGVTRWSGNCSCTPHSEWKEPLRNGLSNLLEAIDEQYMAVLKPYLSEPWQLRHDYIQVLCGKMDAAKYIQSTLGNIGQDENVRIQYLLKAQYERQRMFTSCGWFFDDFDRIEPLNNVAYAAQAVWLTYLATGVDLSNYAINCMKKVQSWRSGLRADVVFNHHLERARSVQQTAQLPLF